MGHASSSPDGAESLCGAGVGVTTQRMATRQATATRGGAWVRLTLHPGTRYTLPMVRCATTHLLSAAVLAFAAAALVIGGCSQKRAPTAAEQAAANEQAAAPDLALYQKLLAEQKPKLAVLVGQQIVSKYPGTAAAAEVQNALPALEAKAEHERLADLWLYQTVKQDGEINQAGALVFIHDPFLSS